MDSAKFLSNRGGENMNCERIFTADELSHKSGHYGSSKSDKGYHQESKQEGGQSSKKGYDLAGDTGTGRSQDSSSSVEVQPTDEHDSDNHRRRRHRHGSGDDKQRDSDLHHRHRGQDYSQSKVHRSAEEKDRENYKRRHHSRSPDRRRHRRSPSRDRERRRRSRSKDRRRESHRSRSPSRDTGRYKRQFQRPRSRSPRPKTVSGGSDVKHGIKFVSATKEPNEMKPQSTNFEGATKSQDLNTVTKKTINLPLIGDGPVQGQRIITAQMAVQQSLAAMAARAQQMTGVTLPKYYNPAAVNPLKYAEQMQKRKLLWQNKEKTVVAPSNNNWERTTFSQDQDGKMAAKFKKLMGIKEAEAAAAAAATAASTTMTTTMTGSNSQNRISVSTISDDHLKKQEELFRTLDQQYEAARITTHTQRGVGLGFSASAAAAATVASLFGQQQLPK